MDAPYAVKQLTQALKDARLAAGDSQKEVADRAGLGQNRLTLIETGEVDLRASTLIQLARALDLELVLVPRRLLPAVQSLTGGHQPKPEKDAERRSVRGSPIRVLRHIERHLGALERAYPESREVAQAKRDTRALLEGGSELRPATIQPLRRTVFWLARARTSQPQAQRYMAKATAQLQELRQTLSQTVHLQQLPRAQPAAYGLEDEIS